MLFSNNMANFTGVCCEAVRSAILATAWLFVYNIFVLWLCVVDYDHTMISILADVVNELAI